MRKNNVKKRHLEAKPYLCDIWEEGEDDGEVEVVCRGAHVNLVWRARTGWGGRPWRVDGETIFKIEEWKFLLKFSNLLTLIKIEL